jgi:hypothetical protein
MTEALTPEELEEMGLTVGVQPPAKSLAKAIETVERVSPIERESNSSTSVRVGRPRVLSNSSIVDFSKAVIICPEKRGRSYLVWTSGAESWNDAPAFRTKKEAIDAVNQMIAMREGIRAMPMWFPAPMQVFDRTVLHCVLSYADGGQNIDGE